MRNTEVLYPLDDDLPEKEVRLHKDAWKCIERHIDDMREGQDISVDQLLLDQCYRRQLFTCC